MVLQSTINELRRSLIANSSVDEILRLTKEIYQLLFNKVIPTNLSVCEQMKSQFSETFSKFMVSNNGLRSNMWLLPQKGEVKTLQNSIKNKVLLTQIPLLFINIKNQQFSYRSARQTTYSSVITPKITTKFSSLISSISTPIFEKFNFLSLQTHWRRRTYVVWSFRQLPCNNSKKERLESSNLC